jgi:hypothetical protein
MRQFYRRPLQQQQEQQQQQAVQQVRPHVHAAEPRASGRAAPSPRSEAPSAGGALDQAAALWTTRRIRSYLRLVDASSEPSQR